ncbi:MAG: hypothetical protein J6Q13_00390 [Clostridia bacterium]|nr:hypothetical protein [Clostridia bacterium]
MSENYNRFDEGASLYIDELTSINNEFEKAITSMDLSIMAQRFNTIYEQLLSIQIELIKEQSQYSSIQIEKYQTRLDFAFRLVHIINKKLLNARKKFISLAKDGTITSAKDAICFTDNDELIK